MVITFKERFADVESSENALSGTCQLQVSYFMTELFELFYQSHFFGKFITKSESSFGCEKLPFHFHAPYSNAPIFL